MASSGRSFWRLVRWRGLVPFRLLSSVSVCAAHACATQPCWTAQNPLVTFVLRGILPPRLVLFVGTRDVPCWTMSTISYPPSSSTSVFCPETDYLRDFAGIPWTILRNSCVVVPRHMLSESAPCSAVHGWMLYFSTVRSALHTSVPSQHVHLFNSSFAPAASRACGGAPPDASSRSGEQ